MISVSAIDFLSYFTEFLLLFAVICSICLLIPQTVRLHKNKYADNSSIGTYVIYLISGIIWVIYAALFIYLHYNDEGNNTLIKVMIWTQLFGDIISLGIGLYSLCLKIYYQKTRNRKKDNRIEQLILKRSKYRNYYDQQKEFMTNTFNVLYNLYPQLCLKLSHQVDTSSLKELLSKSSTTEVSVLNTHIFDYLFNKNQNCTYRVSEEFYANQLQQVKQQIDVIHQTYPDVVYHSNHFKPQKINLTTNSKNQEFINYQTYMQDISLVSAYSFLCEIYQNFLKI